MSIVYNSNIKSLPMLHQGKVRDNYEVDDKHLLMVTTDRLSAFDVILGEPIPHKGKVLNQMALFWFDLLKDVIPNHLTGIAPSQVVKDTELHLVRNRSVVVKKLKPILVEAVVRGYMSGSGWKDYKATGSICGINLPEGMRNSQKFNEPIFTPASKAEVGEHDENITYEKMQNLIGSELADKIKEKSVELYKKASEFALTRGIIIADTKFEFGLDENDNLVLMDEILTPDSSRFWTVDSYALDINPPSFDKQFVRDWLENQPWNKTAPAPQLPKDVQERTAAKYQEAFLRITGRPVSI
ncbi:MAG: phosphoribosylaminoimidazolesuccinocarboxamide synthase [Pseudomonadota bacterium]|jgi:phosphoribosylaminoimidazole-succinocarboxamide synthase